MKFQTACAAAALVIAACPLQAAESWKPYVSQGGSLAGVQPIDAMMVVDCLLPGQMRRSGAMSYMGPRLPVKTTAQLCAMRGGEYTEYDRASLASSLGVWMDKAKGGDATAQFYVGQIYEKGMDSAPDYTEAANWYRKAAAAGSNEAKLSLAAMMESGHGMPADPAGAVNLYREAMGITGNDLISKSESDTRVAEVERKNEALRSELAEQRAAAEANVTRLQGEVAALKSENASRKRDAGKMAALERSLNEAMSARANADEKLTAMAAAPKSTAADGPATRSVTVPRVSAATAESVAADGIRFGKYHALIIGVQNYISYDPLKTPISDAKAIADVLEQRYGFQTTTLLDADFSSIVGGIVELSTKIGPDDNVLIYFAGHGVLNAAQRGFWLPLDARQTERSPALPTETLAEFLAMFKARSILVIADSCFGSALSGAVGSYTGGPAEYRKDIPSGYLSRKARYVLSSGGMSPVLDQAGDGHSVFASALLKVLRDNDRILTQTGLEQALVEPVRASAQQIGLVQTPELKKVREAGDAGGAFFLVPKTAPDKG